jgi:hypothetical protein
MPPHQVIRVAVRIIFFDIVFPLFKYVSNLEIKILITPKIISDEEIKIFIII